MTAVLAAVATTAVRQKSRLGTSPASSQFYEPKSGGLTSAGNRLPTTLHLRATDRSATPTPTPDTL